MYRDVYIMNEGNIHKQYYFMLFVFSTLFMLKNVVGMPIPVVVFLVIVIFTALISEHDEIVALCLSFAAFSSGFQFKYGLLICIVIIFFKGEKEIQNKEIVFSIVAILIWEFLHVIFNVSDSVSEYLRRVCELLFLLVVVATDKEEEIDYSLFARSVIYSSTVSCLIVFLKTLVSYNYNINAMITHLSRLGDVLNEETSYEFKINSNCMGMICNFAIALVIVLMYKRKNSKIDKLCAGILIIMGLLTASRAFLLGLAVNLFTYIFLRRSELKEKLAGILAGVVSLIIGISLIYRFAPSIIERILARFQVEDITNGRMDIMSEYNKFIFHTIRGLIWGTGLQNYSVKVSKILNIHLDAAHNGYQEVMIVWGIPGFFLFGIILLLVIKKYWIMDFVYLLPLISILIQSLSGQLISSSEKLIFIVAVFVTLKSAYWDVKDNNKIYDDAEKIYWDS